MKIPIAPLPRSFTSQNIVLLKIRRNAEAFNSFATSLLEILGCSDSWLIPPAIQQRHIGNVSGIAGGDISGVINLGAISGSVTNAINQIPDTPKESDQPSLKELLLQLQAAIEAESALPPEDKAEALEQVKILAEAGQAPEDGTLKKAAKTAVKVLKGTVAGLPDVTQLVEASAKLPPAITALLAIV
ncbi:MAG: hypothetical protein Kow00121_67710 [Elainellaceae cyanobacterium]